MSSQNISILKRLCDNMTPNESNDSEIIFCSDVKCSDPKRCKVDDKIKNQETFESPVPRTRSLLKVSSELHDVGLSPISEIILNLSDTSIRTPLGDKNKSLEKEDIPENNESATKVPSIDGDECERDGSRLFPEEFQEETDEKLDAEVHYSASKESLISHSFTLNTRGRNDPMHCVDSRFRGARHRLNIAPLTLSYDDDLQDILPDDGNRMAVDEISFYGGHSPQRSIRQCPSSPLMNIGLLSPEGSPQRFTVVQNTVTIVDKRRSVDEINRNSIDSSYGTSSFKFVAPQLPTRLEPSPRKPHDVMQLQSQQCQREKKTSPKSFRIFHSLSSGSTESMEDDIMELFDSDQLDEDLALPSNLNSLISGHIMTVKTPEMKRPPVRRCLSLNENSMQLARNALFEPKTPEILRPVQANTTPFSSRNHERCFKRPEPPSISPVQSKRYKLDEKENKEDLQVEMFEVARPILRKSISLNEANIMTALARSTSEPDLIGDFSKPFCLPLMDGRHRDLKSISSETMARLIRGEFNDSVSSFKIIDCRYPYEYEGGHICGAQNLCTHEQILEELVNSKTEAPEVQPNESKRHILVFHCEFSSERGPKLSRFLRNRDRLRNSHKYPALHYPEIYLLHGGYKEFYENYSELCDPVSYRPMLDPKFGADYRQFRAKSKSWNGDIKASGSINRLTKSRSRLVL